MCGIAGYVMPSQHVKKEFDGSMLRFIARRGPDASGNFRTNIGALTLSLLHARLSIIDTTSCSSQPMQDADTGWVIAYNGEIYNYIELRSELSGLGVKFVSSGDTEVLLKAWALWGKGCLSRLNGMFAFVAFNAKTRELWLVRDRYGVKPLLWGQREDGGITFSSSVAGVASFVGQEIDTEYCARGLRYKTFELPESGAPFRAVRSVRPGGWLKVHLDSPNMRIMEGQWYDLNERVSERAEALARFSADRLVEECKALLADSVKLRLRSDVPLAVSLSGGVDSSTVAAFATQHSSELTGFTYGSAEALRSEGPMVSKFVHDVDVRAVYVWPRYTAGKLGDMLERTFLFQEAPFSNLSVVAQNEVFSEVRRGGFKVLLGGQGGDEIFAGYRKFFVVAVREALGSHSPLAVLHFVWSLSLMLIYEARQARLYWQSLDRYSTKRVAEFQLLDWMPPNLNLWGSGDSLRSRQLEDVQRWSIPSLLRYEDRNSMGHGLETRLPFMDYRLVETALALPSTLKISNGFGKWALRRCVEGAVPDFIRLNRTKRGFDVTQDWIGMGIGDSLRARILDSRSALTPYMKPNSDLQNLLSNERLSNDGGMLDEALMLAWLVDPVRI